MKFVLRDDDVNYHYNVDTLRKWYEGIIDRCLISMSVVPFMKGHPFYWNNILDNHLPFDNEEFLKDNEVFPIGDNVELTQQITDWLQNDKIDICMHGIHHRNEEMEMPELKNNYIRGAEFYVNKNITPQTIEAKEYLEKLFNVKITVFVPPTNSLSKYGYDACRKAHLNISADSIGFYDPFFGIQQYGFINYFKVNFHRLTHKNKELRYREPYLFPFKAKGIKMMDIFRLQPQKDVDAIKCMIDSVHKQNGVFVLNTHSFGFDMMMTNGRQTMKEALIEILDYINEKYPDTEYTTLSKVFEIY